MSDAWASLTTRIGARGLPFREFIVDANDGIIATAGVVEGFAGAGAGRAAVLIAAVSAMLAGAIALGSVKYAEAAAQRDETIAMIAGEHRQLARAPEEQAAELVAYYEAKGLPTDLALAVAEALSDRGGVAAHVEAEHGVDLSQGVPNPMPVAVLAGVGFAAGAAIPLAAAVLADEGRRGLVTFVAVVISLALTAVVQARAGRLGVGRTVLRTVLIGVTAMAVTFVAGRLLQL